MWSWTFSNIYFLMFSNSADFYFCLWKAVTWRENFREPNMVDYGAEVLRACQEIFNGKQVEIQPAFWEAVGEIRCCLLCWSRTSTGLVPGCLLSACPPPSSAPGNVDSFPALLRETVWAFASITGLSPTPSSPALSFSLSQTTRSLTAVWHGGAGTLEAGPQKQRSTGAFPLGQFIRALIYL